MMGFDPGWVTDPSLGLRPGEQSAALGNGVMPAQAELAIRLLCDAIPIVSDR
jgi:hypothetical protein